MNGMTVGLKVLGRGFFTNYYIWSEKSGPLFSSHHDRHSGDLQEIATDNARSRSQTMKKVVDIRSRPHINDS